MQGRRGASLVTASFAAAFVAVYLVAFASSVGNRADAAVFHRVSRTDLEQVRRIGRHFGRHTLDTVAVAVALFTGVSLTLLAFIRGRRDRGWFIPLLIGGSFATTELVKPPLGHLGRVLAPDRLPPDSFPSGHATISMAVVLAAVIAAPPLLRPAVAISGIIWATIMAVLIVAVGLHPPSDVLGGYVISAVWAAFLTLFLRRRNQPSTSERAAVAGAKRNRLVVTVVLGIGCFAVFMLAITQPHLLDTIRLHQTILATTTTFGIAAAIIVSAIARLADEPTTPPPVRSC